MIGSNSALGGLLLLLACSSAQGSELLNLSAKGQATLDAPHIACSVTRRAGAGLVILAEGGGDPRIELYDLRVQPERLLLANDNWQDLGAALSNQLTTAIGRVPEENAAALVLTAPAAAFCVRAYASGEVNLQINVTN